MTLVGPIPAIHRVAISPHPTRQRCARSRSSTGGEDYVPGPASVRVGRFACRVRSWFRVGRRTGARRDDDAGGLAVGQRDVVGGAFCAGGRSATGADGRGYDHGAVDCGGAGGARPGGGE